MTELTHLSLFSGIGGLDLAAECAVVPQQFYPIFRGIAELEECYGNQENH